MSRMPATARRLDLPVPLASNENEPRGKDPTYSLSIWQHGKLLRTYIFPTHDAIRDYVQELITGGLPMESIDFGNGFDITITLPEVVHLFVKWIVEGGPTRGDRDGEE